MTQLNRQKVYRVIDANFNRAKEGLRVCEDVCRFVLDDPKLTRKLKALRHKLTSVVNGAGGQGRQLLRARSIEHDIGRGSIAAEFKRKNPNDIFYANAQRIKESVRVLEEFFKLLDTRRAGRLKTIRYEMYRLEQGLFGRVK